MVKDLPANVGEPSLIRWERIPGEGNGYLPSEFLPTFHGQRRLAGY